MKIYTDCQLTIVSRPSFQMPAHLPVEFIGDATDGEALAEYAGRICYMSQSNPARRTTREYLQNIKKQGHGSVFEHANYSMLIEGVSRSFTHELVRHRAGWAYSQLSQRYVNESDCAFVAPPAMVDRGRDSYVYLTWGQHCRLAQRVYERLSNDLFEQYTNADSPWYIADAVTRRKTAREAARGALPNSTETKVIATANVRAWRTMLELRAGEGAEREMRRFAVQAIGIMQGEAPGMFDDFEVYRAPDGQLAARTTFSKV